MTEKKLSLKNFISREFFKAALLPLLIIEITLLTLYFLMSTYLIDKSIKTLSNDRLSHLLEITNSQALIISEQLHCIADLSAVLQAETGRFFDTPDHFITPDPAPEFGFAPNGVYYKLENNGGSSLFYSSRQSIGPKEKTKALHSESLDPLFENIFHANNNIVAVYLNTFDSMSRYYPFFENVHEQLPAKMNIPEYNFYYLADKTHNPDGKPVWTAAYLDPMGMGWMMSCIVPVYKDRFLEGVAGIDITIKNFIANLLGLQLPWGAHAFLTDSHGTIMAMPPVVETVFGLTELHDFSYSGKVKQDTKKPRTFNLLESLLPSLSKPLADLMEKESGSIEIPIKGNPYVLCQTTVSETGWKLMVMADRSEILSPISNLERHSKHVGYAAIGFMCLFYIAFFMYLVTNTRRMSERIAKTLGGLSTAIRRLGTGFYEVNMEPSPVIELDRLSSNFETMAQDLKLLHENLELEVKHANEAKNAARQAEEKLKEHQVHLEKIVEDRTLEVRTANKALKQDILKRKKIEQELTLERQQLLSIFDSIDEPIYISLPETYELLFANKALKKIYPDYAPGKCYEVLQNREFPCPFCTNDIIFGEKYGRQHIWEHYNLSTDKWFRCIDKAIQWPDGRMVRYEMAIDITDQKKASEEKQRLMAQLRRAEKMEALGTLAGGVAHDLNNVLGAIVAYPDLLLMDIPEDSPLRDPIVTIKQSGKKAAAIVQDLLALARQGISDMEVINLNDLVTSYLLSPEHERLLRYNTGIQLTADLSDSLLNCMGSPVHLSKMVMNLVSNAAEAMPDGGEIFLSTDNRYVDQPLKGYSTVMEGDYVVLKIVDHGIGMTESDMERIFEPFFTKKKMGRSGTGLGMAVVWGTVKDHQGYIEVKSALEEGTTIEIYIPATRKISDEIGQDFTFDELKGSNETIMVVDDVEVQRKIALGMLTRLGYNVVSVASGEEAVSYLKKHSVDLILLDMIMDPGIDGLETYKRIIKINPAQKAVIVSGFSRTEAIKEAQRLGAGPYVKKPYTAFEIGRVLKTELASKNPIAP